MCCCIWWGCMLIVFCLVRVAYELGQDLPITMLSLFMSIAGGVSHSTIGLYHITVFAGKETNLQSQGRPTWMITIRYSVQTEATLIPSIYSIIYKHEIPWTSNSLRWFSLNGNPEIHGFPNELLGFFWGGLFETAVLLLGFGTCWNIDASILHGFQRPGLEVVKRKFRWFPPRRSTMLSPFLLRSNVWAPQRFQASKTSKLEKLAASKCSERRHFPWPPKTCSFNKSLEFCGANEDVGISWHIMTIRLEVGKRS